MRSRLAITIALAVLGVALAAGAVSANSQTKLEIGGAKITIDLPGGGQLPDLGGLHPDCLLGEPGNLRINLADPKCAPDDGGEAPGDGNGGNGEGGGNGGKGGNGEGGGNGSKGGKGGNGASGKRVPDLSRPFGEPEQGGAKRDGKGRAEAEGGPKAKRRPDGSPTRSNSGATFAPFGPAPIGVPNVIIDRFSIPPFLLPIYQACGTQYGIPWQVLASINRIETAFGTNLNVSSAGAVGWMQFMPATWRAYGVDANGDGRKDPYNPVDAICSAARYLKASGYGDDPRKAIFAYNHADWYVDEVLLYARQYGKLPDALIGSLTGLTEGAQFPVAARARYADDISERRAARRASSRRGGAANPAEVIAESPTRRGINIFAKRGSPVVAVNDGVIQRIGQNDRLGNFIVLKDGYGNKFTYARLGKIADTVPVPRNRRLTARDFRLVRPGADGEARQVRPANAVRGRGQGGNAKAGDRSGPANTEDARERLFALPERPANRDRADLTGQLDDLLADRLPGWETFKAYFTGVLRFDSNRMERRPLRKGSKVVAGTLLARVGGADAEGTGPHMNFAIEPVGRGSRMIDPKPILDGWKLLEATAIYRAAGENPFADGANVGQILLMSKPQLQRTILRDPRIEIHACGRDDIRTGRIDRRVLASIAYLTQRGLHPTITSLRCGRETTLTASGNVSHHSSGHAVDIAALNGIPVLGNQGRGSITEAAVKELLKLQGALQPAQIITLMEIGGPTFAMSDHADHIHIGYQPQFGPGEAEQRIGSLLNPRQWDRLLNRIGELDQPTVPIRPSKDALPSRKGQRANRSGGE